MNQHLSQKMLSRREDSARVKGVSIWYPQKVQGFPPFRIFFFKNFTKSSYLLQIKNRNWTKAFFSFFGKQRIGDLLTSSQCSVYFLISLINFSSVRIFISNFFVPQKRISVILLFNFLKHFYKFVLVNYCDFQALRFI